MPAVDARGNFQRLKSRGFHFLGVLVSARLWQHCENYTVLIYESMHSLLGLLILTSSLRRKLGDDYKPCASYSNV